MDYELWHLIEDLAFAQALRRSVWAYPILEVVHIASIGALFGSLLLLELRMLGVAAAVALRPLARVAVRVALFGFLGAAASGMLLFITRATEIAVHPAFQAKLVLIGLAGINAAWFHLRDGVGRQDRVARVQSMLSLTVWIAAIAAGRLIAYL